MGSSGLRTIGTVAVPLAGIVAGFAAAAVFNGAGLIWTGKGVGTALYWKPLESSILVFFGCVFLIGWLGSVIFLMLVATMKSLTTRRRIGLWVSTLLSFCIVVSALAAALVILPAQYEWVKY